MLAALDASRLPPLNATCRSCGFGRSLAPTLAEEVELKARCRDSLPAAVQEAFDYWVDWRKPETVRHETPKVGRNDPCPCGSGKKYKACHGA